MFLKLTLHQYQILSLVSGFLITFCFASVYTLGTISPYLASYIFHTSDSSITVVDVSILYPTFMVSQCIGMTISMVFLRKILGFKTIGFIGIYGFISCVIISSYCQNLSAYVFFYAFLYGTFVGIAYMIPLLNCYAYLPDKKGLCSGICMTAFGVGAFVFNQIFLYQINPQDQDPNHHHIFSQKVSSNVPHSLRFISVIYFIIGTLGCLLIIPKSGLNKKILQKNNGRIQQANFNMNNNSIEEKNIQLGRKISIENQNHQDNTSKNSQQNQNINNVKQITIVNQYQNKSGIKTDFKQLLKTKQYKQLFLMIITSTPFAVFIAFNYKQYGQSLQLSDQLITLIGSLGALSNSASKLFWCYMMDKYSFKLIIIIMNTSQIIYMILIILVQDKKIYAVLVILIYFSFGAIYGIYPAQTMKVYGDVDGARIYSVIFTGFSLAAIVQFMFHFVIVKSIGDIGFIYCFLIFGILLIVAQVLFYNIDFQEKYNQNQNIFKK